MTSRSLIAGAAILALGACADKSDKIAASYVSPTIYQGMICQQLA